MGSLKIFVPCEETDWSAHLFDLVSIRFRSKGRIRFHLDFAGDEILSDNLRRELHKLNSVKLEAYSTRTRSVLVSYDPMQASELVIAQALFRGIKEFARLHGECDMHHHHHENTRHAHAKDCAHDHASTATDSGIRKELFKLLLTGGTLGFLVFRKFNQKTTILQANSLGDLASFITILSGYPIFRAGFNAVRNKQKATDDTLIGIAVIATIFLGESITGLSVVWLINLGRLLEAITLKRSRTAIKELIDIVPPEAWVLDPLALLKRVAVEKLHKGQTIRIFESEKVPLDGKIIVGTALVQEAFITGEAIPREKVQGDTVYAGSLVMQGEIDVEVTNLVHDTVVARIIDAIENMRDQKAPIEKVGTKFAGHFVPLSLGIAGLTFLLTKDLRRSITMLVIACPCAAGLATPTAVSASIGQAARKGILIKGGTHLESAAKINTIIFDKTGTLTQGHPIFQKYISYKKGSLSFTDALRLAASAEQYTTHPLGIIIVAEAKKQGLSLFSIDTHQSYPGMGIQAKLDNKSVQIGNLKLFEFLNIKISPNFVTKVTKNFIAGESIIYLAINHQLQGAFLVQDELRSEAKKMIADIKKLGIKRILLASGDQKIAADFVARQLGIKEVHAELLPKDKLELVSSLKAKGYKVAMVGDGINDAQALTAADLSIAMGQGRCDIAIEAADVTLARNDLALVTEVLDISQKTLKTIYQNFAASVGINAGGLIIGALGKLSPFSAALVHNASTIAVVLNSLRLGKEVSKSNILDTLKEVSL
jgi:heavy metal translocating P-type ATPase